MSLDEPSERSNTCETSSPCQHTFRTLFPGSRMDFRGAFLSSPSASCRHTMPRGPSSLCQQLSEVMSGLHMTTAFHRTVERRNKRVWWPILPTEIRAKRASFRLIAPLDETRTAYLAKKLTFATPRPCWLGTCKPKGRPSTALGLLGKTGLRCQRSVSGTVAVETHERWQSGYF